MENELSKVVEEGKITCVGQKDILTLALGTSEHPRLVREKSGKKTDSTHGSLALKAYQQNLYLEYYY